MRVLVRIQMSGLNAGALHLAHLRGQLIVDADAAPGDLLNQLGHRGGKPSLPTSTRCTPTSSDRFSRASATA